MRFKSSNDDKLVKSFSKTKMSSTKLGTQLAKTQNSKACSIYMNTCTAKFCQCYTLNSNLTGKESTTGNKSTCTYSVEVSRRN